MGDTGAITKGEKKLLRPICDRKLWRAMLSYVLTAHRRSAVIYLFGEKCFRFDIFVIREINSRSSLSNIVGVP